MPGHIRAALEGNTADSAGRPWAGRDLAGGGNPLHNYDHDDGGASAVLTAALTALLDGSGDEAGVIAALASVRVFVPVVAQLATPVDEAPGDADRHAAQPPDDPHGRVGHPQAHDGVSGDKEADMALVTLKAPDGRTALPVFSSADQLERWHADARPVAVYAPRAALSAVSDGSELMVLDPGSDFTFVVRRPALWALAQQKPWTPSYADAGLAALVAESITADARIVRVEAGPGSGVSARATGGKVASGGGPGPELSLVITLCDGLTQDEVRGILDRLQRDLKNNREFVERVDSLEVRLTR
ncbi:SseB family protein [Arthrobacter sp. H5]|uniref:SseB family protein n=1 Tax=Arthrobacter sp. H5 TaxID=1267973 RepID=UPI0020A674F2|nr:SseB family protein [Arthrobacter sp. H5]